MNIILIGILVIVGMGVIVGASTLISRHNSTEPDVVAPAVGDCATCSGINDDCEQTCMMEAATKEVEYYDDEELDRFKSQASTPTTKPKSSRKYSTPCDPMRLKVGTEV